MEKNYEGIAILLNIVNSRINKRIFVLIFSIITLVYIFIYFKQLGLSSIEGNKSDSSFFMALFFTCMTIISSRIESAEQEFLNNELKTLIPEESFDKDNTEFLARLFKEDMSKNIEDRINNSLLKLKVKNEKK